MFRSPPDATSQVDINNMNDQEEVLSGATGLNTTFNGEETEGTNTKTGTKPKNQKENPYARPYSLRRLDKTEVDYSKIKNMIQKSQEQYFNKFSAVMNQRPDLWLPPEMGLVVD